MRTQTSYFKKCFFCSQTGDYLCSSCLPREVQLCTHYYMINHPQDHIKTIPNCYENPVEVQSIPSSVADL